ncbi:domain of Kin17 curved DNA-binding protein-domain-containing protein [Polychytrium aggregatum]|uniref:domain of Kin17 curved DNA-binding protein-domain-containing protein n=1 Tax=Polychytrium aggregatum TaxID=110093 RepID=UPI0022FE09C0|nr:domain of Kin17 curved DNA-binding protein-domain-containing protein [Polychytrium aggregatum]KAI9206916.1 domain of Kin17 curved DNA-binding protein-domain-containing protein [Polychytrium aggregatum]
MGGDNFLTPKAIANRIKAKGLQKLRWYCQMCEKQCRDENGFKCHCASEAHQRQMLLFAESASTYMSNFSKQFLDDFIRLLSRRYGTRRVHANLVYQEYISDRHHLHMNSTEWNTLTDFCKYLGKNGLADVEETPKGWFIAWIDRSPEALAKQAAILKQDRMAKTEEERDQRLLQEQIEKAQREAVETQPEETFTELKRESEGEKIKLTMSFKSTSKLAKPEAKRPNVFKMGTASSKSSGASSAAASTQSPSAASAAPSRPQISDAQPKKLSAVEQIMLEESERKRKLESRTDRGGGDLKRSRA